MWKSLFRGLADHSVAGNSRAAGKTSEAPVLIPKLDNCRVDGLNDSSHAGAADRKTADTGQSSL